MKQTMKMISLWLSAMVFVMVMTGCSGGSSGSSSTGSSTEVASNNEDATGGIETTSREEGGNTPPIAYAGKDKRVFLGDRVYLDATFIPDEDGDELRYIWKITEKPSKSKTTIEDKYTANPFFRVDEEGTYKVRLVVNDSTDNAADYVEFTTELKASNFTMMLGDNPHVDGNWKALSRTNDEDAQARVKGQGMTGTFSISGDEIRYEGTIDENQTDSGIIEVYRDDDKVEIAVTVYDNLYLFSGIKTELPIDQLEGWQECFRETYRTSGSSLADIKNICNKEKIMLSCKLTGSNILQVAAYADRSEVFYNTGNGNDVVHTANGVDWYYSESYSMGFAPVDAGVYRNSADVEASGFYGGSPVDATSTYRLSWHTGSSRLNGGWRCGAAVNLNGSTSYERVIYQAD